MLGILDQCRPRRRIASVLTAVVGVLAALIVGVAGPQPATASVAVPGSTTCDATGCWTAVESAPGPLLLGGVSCVGPGFCVAVGGGAQRWNGIRWSEMDTSDVLTTDHGFSDVSCTSVSFCVAVGAGAPAMWDGSTWSSMADPNTGRQLSGVSCKSPSFCIGVGITPGQRSYAEMWNGSDWSAMTTAEAADQPDYYYSDLSRVSCSSTTFCMAVGYENRISLAGATIQMWNGHKWSITPTHEAKFSTLADVSCAGSYCVAVGDSYGMSEGSDVTLAEEWKGGAWSIMTTTNPSPYLNLPIPGCDTSGGCEDKLLSVSCTSATSCTAVGVTADVTFAEKWNGTLWSTMTTSNPSSPAGLPAATQHLLTGVSCITSDTCVATGYYGDKHTWARTLTEVHSALPTGLRKINPTDPLA
ncbi:MAG TPA: hypothetical protein VHD81_06780 [Mycobacteriales bacterium]|nr:hypothetical protein [Mycobacteriales bacterium]